MTTTKRKLCSACRRNLPVDRFGSAVPGGPLRSECKACMSVRSGAYFTALDVLADLLSVEFDELYIRALRGDMFGQRNNAGPRRRALTALRDNYPDQFAAVRKRVTDTAFDKHRAAIEQGESKADGGEWAGTTGQQRRKIRQARAGGQK